VDDDLAQLTNDELVDLINDLQIEAEALVPFVEDRRAWNRRTIRLVRGTVLTAGGFFGATFDPISLLLVLLGFIDWLEAIVDDARALNQQLTLRQRIVSLRRRIEAALAELERRRPAPNE